MCCVLKNQERKLKSLRMQNDVGMGFFFLPSVQYKHFHVHNSNNDNNNRRSKHNNVYVWQKKYSKSGIIKERRETWNQRCLKNCYFRPKRASNEMRKRSMHNLTVFAVFRRICHSFVGIWFLRNKDWCWRCITMCIFNFFFRCLSK